MLKRKLLVIIIPVLATSVLVCAGFSAWYFNAGTVSTSAQLGVKVTEMHVTTGALSTNLPETATIVLDQGGASKATDLTEKIFVGTPAGNTYTPLDSFTVTFTIPTASANGLKDSRIKGHFELKPTVNETLSKYVEVTITLLTLTQDFTFTDGESLGGSWVKTTDESNTTYTATISLPASNAENTPFKYKDNSGLNGGKPLNAEQYTAMEGALSSVTNAISFAATVVFEIIA